MKITNREYVDITRVIKGLLDHKKTKLKNDTFTQISDSDIIVIKNNKEVKEKEICLQIYVENAKAKYNYIVDNLKI